jgi:LacI family transcriptional regulator
MKQGDERKQNGRPTATLAGISKRSEVSVSAVSRILAGKKLHTFTEETINRVRAIAEELRYRPNRLVRGIQTGQTGLVGVVIPAHGYFYGQVMAGIHDALVEEDRVPVVLWSKQDSPHGRGRTELEQIHALVDLRVEGIILKPVFDAASDQYFQEIVDRKIPLVVVDRGLPRTHCCFVGSDDEAGMAQLIDHLSSLGHRNIVYFGPDSPVSTSLHRLQAFRFFASQNATISPREHLTTSWNPTIEDALAGLKSLKPPFAVVAVNDSFAWLIYQAARRLHLRIPDDVSVVGFGNLNSGQFMDPPLTSVDQYPYDVGVNAAQRLLSRIRNPDEKSSKLQLAPNLIVRTSTAPCRKT